MRQFDDTLWLFAGGTLSVGVPKQICEKPHGAAAVSTCWQAWRGSFRIHSSSIYVSIDLHDLHVWSSWGVNAIEHVSYIINGMELGSHTCIVNHRNMGRSPTTHILAKLNCEKNPIVISNLPRRSKTGWGGENWDGPGLHGWPGSTPFHLRSWRTFVYTTRDKLRPWVENRNSSMTGVHPMHQEFTTIVIAIVIIIIINTIYYHHSFQFIDMIEI